MFEYLLPAIDLVCIVSLTALYFYRHRRADLSLAYLAVNVGVLAVAAALAATSVNVGLGLGLFGVLAMIRLRSAELDQHEIAYYFTALALGLIGGLGWPMGWTAVALMVAIVIVMAIADSRLGARRYTNQTVVVDRAISDPELLKARLEDVLGAQVVHFATRKLDLVNDLTVVDVRFCAERPRAVGLADFPAPHSEVAR
ncbi:MAG: DUF4956 domain-containing protein [Propionibacteriaceae bacterium]|jgi:hypothetical protein|nr:DUF4956 domain-containing protein [Propionibacteriaceae bacterium]